MHTNAVSDLATGLRARRDNAALKAALNRAATEMTTGTVSDAVAATGGQLADLLDIEHRIALTQRFGPALAMASRRLGAAQAALSGISATAGQLAPDLIAATGRGDVTAQASLAAFARTGLEAAVAALNGRVAGQALFAGAATDAAAVDAASAILGDIGTIVSAQPDAATAAAAVSAYFADPAGGFQSARYLGSQQPGPRMKVGENEEFPALPAATDPAILSVLEGLALAASVDGGAFAGAPDQRSALLAAAGQKLLGAADGLQSLRAGLGQSEGRAAEIETGLAASRHALDLARNEILAIDQFDAASRFEALRGQLETGYLATATVSRLSLAGYLR